MLYDNLLKNGHWESFIQFLWTRKKIGIPIADWSKQAKKNEDAFLLELFEQDVTVLMQQVREYFAALPNNSEKCQRCNESFQAKHKKLCSLCGWDILSASKTKSKVVKSELNAKFVAAQIAHIEAQMTFEKLDSEARFWNAQVDHINQHTALLKEEIETERTKANFEKNKKGNLEDQIANLNEQNRQLELMLRNAESLFQPYEGHSSTHIIELILRGNFLHAIARPPTIFPIDLIMGVQKETDAPPVKTINKTCCFVFIHENHWEKLSNSEWKVDLSEIARGKIQGTYFLNFFSHLHKNDHKTNIRYQIKKLTFA